MTSESQSSMQDIQSLHYELEAEDLEQQQRNMEEGCIIKSRFANNDSNFGEFSPNDNINDSGISDVPNMQQKISIIPKPNFNISEIDGQFSDPNNDSEEMDVVGDSMSNGLSPQNKMNLPKELNHRALTPALKSIMANHARMLNESQSHTINASKRNQKRTKQALKLMSQDADPKRIKETLERLSKDRQAADKKTRNLVFQSSQNGRGLKNLEPINEVEQSKLLLSNSYDINPRT